MPKVQPPQPLTALECAVHALHYAAHTARSLGWHEMARAYERALTELCAYTDYAVPRDDADEREAA
jgi:hypothetical protein